jgi:glycosyltransferase involved in cell wall biosynthesis
VSVAKLHDEMAALVAARRTGGAYGPGLEDGLDAHGRTMVAVRVGPGGERHLRPRRRGWSRLRRRLDRRHPDRGGGAGPDRSLRILFVVQRFGVEVAGGAELLCRLFAVGLVGRGHRVDVVTSRAQSAHDWADIYPPGRAELDGVTIHRLGVSAPRDRAAFEALTMAVLWSGALAPLSQQAEWRQQQGPDLPELLPWLADRSSEYDVAVHVSYLYTPTWAGLPVTSSLLPTVLHATAHDEPAFWLPIFDDLFDQPTLYAWSTEEERDLLDRRGAPRRGAIIGIGTDLDATGDGERFRNRAGLGERPYLVFVGRVEAGKGSEELIEFFVAYKERNPGPLALVFVGPAEDRRPHPDIVYTGFVDDQTRTDALAGSLALAQPSFFESFSMVLTEAWAQRRPVLVQGRTDVLVGQVRRSGGGLYYAGFAEFEAALDLLVSREGLADSLGRSGRGYVEQHYRWDVVLSRYEDLLRRAVRSRPRGSR